MGTVFASSASFPAAKLLTAASSCSTGDVGKGFVTRVMNRDDGKEWGALRGKSAKETANGSREAVSAEYRERVDAYFRVLAERARTKK